MGEGNTVFSFGIANEINPQLTTGKTAFLSSHFLIHFSLFFSSHLFSHSSSFSLEFVVCLFVTILFVNMFEHLTRLLEHSISHSYIYNRMLQRIYMELMSTGFTSILIAMYRAGYPTLHASNLLLSMDFAGYFIFFISIFHVIHGLYIISLSLFTTKEYNLLYHLPTSTLLSNYKKQILTSKISLFFYLIQYSPISLSLIRKQFEFKLLFSLFRHTYWLPINFDYGLYLSQCFERYSERIMTIGSTGWIILLFGILLNFLRTSYGTDITMNCSQVFSPSSNSTHSYLLERRKEEQRCDWVQLQLFCIYGVCMAGYILIVFIVGRIYVLRSNLNISDLSFFLLN